MKVKESSIDAFAERWVIEERKHIKYMTLDFKNKSGYFNQLCNYMNRHQHKYEYQHVKDRLTINQYLYSFNVSTKYNKV